MEVAVEAEQRVKMVALVAAAAIFLELVAQA
jgi:hypothetical protein